MPPRPLAPCRKPGCPAVTRNPGGYCDAHLEYADGLRREREARKRTLPFYLTARWRKLRDWYISQHPLCEACGRAKATEVDHKRELKDGGSPTSKDNLQALCHACHSRKTAEAAKARRGRQGEGGANP